MKESIKKEKKTAGSVIKTTNTPIRYDKCDEIVAAITKFGIKHTKLAAVLGINTPSFAGKINQRKYEKFSPEQKNKLLKHIHKVGIELLEVK